jgi:hypothetical protein
VTTTRETVTAASKGPHRRLEAEPRRRPARGRNGGQRCGRDGSLQRAATAAGGGGCDGGRRLDGGGSGWAGLRKKIVTLTLTCSDAMLPLVNGIRPHDTSPSGPVYIEVDIDIRAGPYGS